MIAPPIADKTTTPHLLGLNGMRAAACLAVFGVHFHQHTNVSGKLGHLDIDRLLENGNSGVAFFFILSGYLLSLPYWSGQQGPVTLWALIGYATRRIARIVPAYFVCLSALVVIHGYWTTPKQCIDTALHYLFLHNYTEFSFYSISEPFWTIAVQAQFYIIFPVLLLLLRPLGLRINAAFVAILALCLGCYLLHRWMMFQTGHAQQWPLHPLFVTKNGAVLSHSVLAHLPLFLIGVLAGRLSPTCNTLAIQPPSATVAIGCELTFWTASVIVITILGTPFDDAIQVAHGRYHLPIVPILIAVMIICVPLAPWTRRVLNSRPMVGLGTISYGIYVYHLPCQNTVARIMDRLEMPPTANPMAFALTSLTISITVAMLSYQLLERPILRTVHHQVGPRRS